MSKASPFRTIVFVALAVLLVVVVVKFFEAQGKKSDISEFVDSLKNTKPSPQGGILPQAPIETIKQVEKFMSRQTIKDTVIDYRLSISFGKNKETYNLTVSAASNPFRWRISFTDSKTNYQTTFINNGNSYYACNSYEKTCDKFSSLDEINSPIPLTNFLNAFLDPAQLKRFINKTPETSIKIIANKTATCLKASDENEIIEVCTDKESSVPLLIFVKRKLDEYTLEAIRVNISALPADIFSLPYPVFGE